MPASASSVRPNRYARRASRHIQGPAQLVLLAGVLFWGTFFVRSAVRSSSVPQSTLCSKRSESSKTSAIDIPFAAPLVEEDDVSDNELSETQNPNVDVNGVTTDLTVQSVLLSPTRRIAMIGDHLISEGQSVLLRGHSFKVTAVCESGVDLAIAETRIHLPLAASFESEMPQE